jgi:hypothetical protein
METISHAEQYKALREEIMLYIQQVYRTELSAAVAVGATYAWLLVNKSSAAPVIKVPAIVWAIPPFLIFLSLVRCSLLVLEMKRIAIYLKRIEEAAFGSDPQLPGWERFKVSKMGSSFDKKTIATAGFLWVTAQVATVWFSLAMCR